MVKRRTTTKAHPGEWEPLLTVNEYYDGPVFGIALYRGVPHVYDLEWDAAADEYGSHYRLNPIPTDLLDLVLEDWAIWLRWQGKHLAGEISLETHPALPEERARHEEIKALIGGRFNALRDGPIRLTGKLRGGNGQLEVVWSEIVA